MSVYLGDPRRDQKDEWEWAPKEGTILESLVNWSYEEEHRKTVLKLYDYIGSMMIGREESLMDDRLLDWEFPFMMRGH